MKKPSTNETSAGMKNVIEKCEKEGILYSIYTIDDKLY